MGHSSNITMLGVAVETAERNDAPASMIINLLKAERYALKKALATAQQENAGLRLKQFHANTNAT